jgi:deoxyadenosine/deoxycytidine kinase
MQKTRKLHYIAVDGPIGAGKTTLVNMLAEDMKGDAMLEPVEKNPFLPDFYKDPKQNSFKAQLFFLLNRYQQQVNLKQHDLFKPLVVCDYTFAKDWIFAHINLNDDELNLYNTIFQLLHQRLPKPDLVIYLRADSKVMLNRVKKRGYDYEKPITGGYLDKLTDAYNQFFLNYDETPLLVVDTSHTDYQGNPSDYENLKKAILSHRGGTVHLIAR